MSAEITKLSFDSLPTYAKNAAQRGFRFFCRCGEMYFTAERADGCRKCRKYLTDDQQREYNIEEIVDIPTKEVK